MKKAAAQFCDSSQENHFAPKSLSLIRLWMKAVNLIRSRALNYRQFRNFLDATDAEFAGIPYFTEIRWPSRGRTLKRFYDIREHVAAFLEEKEIRA
ncbi:Hypothetical predicted protein [Octopus vulgaris]|uniref:Uncharacterized protein n=1 Tax=Octopus vulgaris TaxID=6645 RepID=A0AA36FBB7_OCTVU|nr:Hypothetical predicted protein [Octopus vulgaris]